MWEPMPSGCPTAAWAAYDRAQGVSQVAAPNKSPNSGAFNLDRFDTRPAAQAPDGEDASIQVDRAGIEPATHGFSVRCSTN